MERIRAILSRFTNVCKRSVHAMNDYFFVVDPDEPPDYVSASIFYGSIGAILLTGVVVAAVAIL